MSLLVPGLTCWRKASAERLALIRDAGPLFLAMATAMESARRTLFILGWDLDSRTILRPGAERPEDRVLLPLLCACLERNPALHIFILVWDFSVIYAFEREPRPRRQFGRAHPRLHFSLDANHGSGGSHHQKVVVIDDTIAFVGGVDLTLHRWDIPDHKVVDPRRVDASGAMYEPFHDVHAAVTGPAAMALGELARARWQSARRRPTPPVQPSDERAVLDAMGGGHPHPIWPPELTVDATQIEVGLSRTWVAPDQSAIREIESLTLRAIDAATRWIYAENQYLTSGAIVRALGQRLASPRGPEIVLVLPAVEFGWMERSSMGLLREEALAYLRRADQGGGCVSSHPS